MKRIFLGAVFFISLGAAAQDKKLDLKGAVETAIQNNITVRRTELLTDAAQVNWKQAKANLLPSLNGNASHGTSYGRSIDPYTNSYINQKINFANYGLSSGAILFNGMSLQNAVKQNAFAYEASKMELQQSKDNLTLDVILAYMQVLTNRDLVELLKKQVLVTTKQVERSQILNQNGAINPPILSDLIGQLKNEELAVVNAENTMANSLLTLTQLMNVPFDRSIQLEEVSAEDFAVKYAGSSSDVIQKALQQLAAVKAAELRKRSAQSAYKSIKGQLFPELSINGGTNTNFSSAAARDIFLGSSFVPSSSYVTVNGIKSPVMVQQNNFKSEKLGYSDQVSNNIYYNFYLGLRIPIFNSFQTKNRMKLAKIDMRNAELLAENTTLQIKQQSEQAYLYMDGAWQRYKLLVEQVSAYGESFRAAEVRFAAGAGTSVDYLIAKNNLDRANANLVIAKYEYILRKKMLDYLSGQLIY